jgi:nitrogen-specific signal transduction histidine kinase
MRTTPIFVSILALAGCMESDNGNTAKPTRLVPLAVLRLATDLRYELAVADRRVEAVRSRIVADTSLNRNFTELANAIDSAFLVARELISFARRIGQLDDVDVNELVHENRGVIERMLGDSIKMRIESDPRLPTARADALQLEWMLLGLILNARDAISGTGTVTLTTRLLERSAEELFGKGREGDWIRVTCSDTGPGAHHVPQDASLLPPHPEAGDISLGAVAMVARGLGGWLHSESLLPSGTAIHLYLPATGHQPRRRPTPFDRRA